MGKYCTMQVLSQRAEKAPNLPHLKDRKREHRETKTERRVEETVRKVSQQVEKWFQNTYSLSVVKAVREHHSKGDTFWRNFREHPEMGLQLSLRSSYHAWRGNMGENSEILVWKIQLLSDRGCYQRITKDGSWHFNSKREMLGRGEIGSEEPFRGPCMDIEP